MPAKGMCPDCGMKMRGPAHLCDPMRVERFARRQGTLTRLAQQQK